MIQIPCANAMTVDVEDYFHVSGFADRISPSDWDHFPSRVETNTRQLLELLSRHSVKGTFFVLGWIADRFPELVKEIQDAGHEIGCHSYWHRLVYDLTPKEFRDDLSLSRKLIEDVTGVAVTLYRAPSFSITRRSLWALDVLAEEGFTCDSSIYPVYHDRYGIPNGDRFPHRILTTGGELFEFPGAVTSFSGMNLAVSGGGYFRLYPKWMLDRCLKSLSPHPFMFYIHPWEIDPDQPRLPGSILSRLRHYQNLSGTSRKLEWLLPRFPFAPMGTVLEAERHRVLTWSLNSGLYDGPSERANVASTEAQTELITV